MNKIETVKLTDKEQKLFDAICWDLDELQRRGNVRDCLEKVGQLAEEHFHELLGGHGRAVGMPKSRGHHVLNGPSLAVCEFDLDLLRARNGFRTGTGWFVDCE